MSQHPQNSPASGKDGEKRMTLAQLRHIKRIRDRNSAHLGEAILKLIQSGQKSTQ